MICHSEKEFATLSWKHTDTRRSAATIRDEIDTLPHPAGVLTISFPPRQPNHQQHPPSAGVFGANGGRAWVG